MDIKLTISRKWFDMILSGEKPEEYREVKKYWDERLSKCFSSTIRGETYYPIVENIHFFNGPYLSERLPNFKVKFEGAEIREGNPKWGAVKGTKYYVLKLGEVDRISIKL